MDDSSDTARRGGFGLPNPLVRYFDRRFADLHTHLDNSTGEVTTHLARAEEQVALGLRKIVELQATIEGVRADAAAVAEEAARMEVAIRGLREELVDESQTIAEIALTLRRHAELVVERLERATT
jgi:hypothetical protein